MHSQKQPILRLKQLPIQHSLSLYIKNDVWKRLKVADKALFLVQSAEKVDKLVVKQVQEMCEKARDAAIALLEKAATEEEEQEKAVAGALYCCSCVLVSSSLLLDLRLTSTADLESIKQTTRSALRALDLAILRSESDKDWIRVCQPLLIFASDVQATTYNDSIASTPKRLKKVHNSVLPAQYLMDSKFARGIPRIEASNLSIKEFEQTYMKTSQPIIITNAINSWPALHLWRNLDYLKERASGRLVPVEITSKQDAGRSFMSDSWSHKFMGLDEYIEQYVQEGGGKSEAGYLAQHPLFDQLPQLRADISIPSYCAARTIHDKRAPAGAAFATDPLVSAWFGGKGTVSTIHNDPYENTLAQIVGSKYIRIYDTSQSHRLYPVLNHLGHNSPVDLENPDLKRYPLFKDTPCWQGILKAGELLYIPRNAWHYVRSLETSFSASYWFGAKMHLVPDEKNSKNFNQEYLFV